jgi:hypothetical protein
MVAFGLEGGGQTGGPAGEVLGAAGELVHLFEVTFDRDAYVVGLIGGAHRFVSSGRPAMIAWIVS